MKEETLAKRIEEKASEFKSRAVRSPQDRKRHDLVKPDERRAMCAAHQRLGWSYAKIAGVFNRDQRTVKVFVYKEQTILTKRKEYQQKVEQHFIELSIIASTLASNFGSYVDVLSPVAGFTDEVGATVYGGSICETGSKQSVTMQQVDRRMASNLLDHLRERIPELADISDWTQMPIDRLSKDFIVRLKLKANRGSFSGKCPDCPR